MCILTRTSGHCALPMHFRVWQREEREEWAPWGPRNLGSQRQRNREPKRKLITKFLRQQKKYRLQRDGVCEHAWTREVTGMLKVTQQMMTQWVQHSGHRIPIPEFFPHTGNLDFQNNLHANANQHHSKKPLLAKKKIFLMKAKIDKDVRERIISCILQVGNRLVQPCEEQFAISVKL